MPGAYNARGIKAAEKRTHSRKGWGKVYGIEEDYAVLDGGRIDGAIDWMQRNRSS